MGQIWDHRSVYVPNFSCPIDEFYEDCLIKSQNYLGHSDIIWTNFKHGDSIRLYTLTLTSIVINISEFNDFLRTMPLDRSTDLAMSHNISYFITKVISLSRKFCFFSLDLVLVAIMLNIINKKHIFPHWTSKLEIHIVLRLCSDSICITKYMY